MPEAEAWPVIDGDGEAVRLDMRDLGRPLLIMVYEKAGVVP